MTFHMACQIFSYRDLRALMKSRRMRWYSYLNKREMAFRLFGMDAAVNRGICQINQLRRYKVAIPDDIKQWETIR